MITNGPRKHLGGGIILINAAAEGGGGKLPPFVPILEGHGWCSGLNGVICRKLGLTKGSISVIFLFDSGPSWSHAGRRFSLQVDDFSFSLEFFDFPSLFCFLFSTVSAKAAPEDRLPDFAASASSGVTKSWLMSFKDFWSSPWLRNSLSGQLSSPKKLYGEVFLKFRILG